MMPDRRLVPTRLAICRALFAAIPETRLFSLKARLLHWAGVELGQGVRLCSSATLLGAGRISIGAGTWVGHQVMLVSGSSLTIGANVDLGPRVFIGTGTHEKGVGKAAGRGVHKDVHIGDGAWIGAAALILPGVTIGERCTVGAGAVGTRST
jgi:acetyltransferase-like isoleucine patch superfamily enzyme